MTASPEASHVNEVFKLLTSNKLKKIAQGC